MADTRLSNPVIVSSNTDPAPRNVTVTPANGSDGTYTWTCVGQKDTGSTSIITFSVSGAASNPQIVSKTTNQVSATCQVKASTKNYVQVTAAFTSPSNSSNWTIAISGSGTGSTVRFMRGTGGGTVRRPVRKAAVRKATKPAGKKAAKKAAKKAVKKAAAKPARKAAKTIRKTRGK
ncbi:MAG: hypothetical protein IPM12_15730 [Flavobacteriales bacterium]|nr:hypothetical protein [Flavobacteriales bacterium]